MGFAVVHRHKAVVIGVTQKARRDGVTLVARIVVDVMHSCGSTCTNVKKNTLLILGHMIRRLYGRVQVEMKH